MEPDSASSPADDQAEVIAFLSRPESYGADAGAVERIETHASLVFLALLGAIGARAGGADVLVATARVTFWGALAMALTAGIGWLFGTTVG